MSAPLEIDVHRQAQAREYARLRRRLFFVDLAVTALILTAWLGLGWAGALKAALLGWISNEWLLVAAYGVIFYLSIQVFELPLGYYTGFVLPHRYGQSNQTLGGWLRDLALETMLSAALGLTLLEALYWLLRATGDAWWLWAGAGFAALTVGLSFVAPTLIMPLFNKYVPLGPEHATLVGRLQHLAERAGTRVSGVYRFDMSRRTKAANAALTGLGGTRRIILGDTLLNEFTVDEVETVIAHELGHHVHRDISVGIVVGAIVNLGGFGLAALIMRAGTKALGLAGPADIAALPLLVLALGAFGLVTMPVSNAYSRWREVRADTYALESTRKPHAFADAMSRLANQNLAEADPEPWVVILLHSHPPVRQRVAHAAAWAEAHATATTAN
ncbi:MAG: M48 family metallopeptidase [Anaerolineales bacterium]|nr:M48 family metallopeptidase [Anaerolineales bacterium]